MSYAGIFLLGFGGGRWTSDIAVNYFKTVLGVGLQLFTMVLLVGIGKTFIDQYYQAMGDGAVNLKSMFVMLVSSIVLLVLVNKIPPMIGSIPGGASMGGIGGFGAGALIGAVGGAGAAITTAGGAIVLGGAGGASALKAAFESAQQAMSEESGSGGYDGGEDTGAVMPSGDGDTGEQVAILPAVAVPVRVLWDFQKRAKWHHIWQLAWRMVYRLVVLRTMRVRCRWLRNVLLVLVVDNWHRRFASKQQLMLRAEWLGKIGINQ